MTRLEEIEALLEGITPEEWRVITGPNPHWSHIVADVGRVENLVLADVQNHEHEGNMIRLGTANARFIAAAPGLLRWAVTRIKELETLLVIADRALADINNSSNYFDATQASFDAITKMQELRTKE